MDTMNKNGLSQEQLELIERFQTAYNSVDHDLRKLSGADKTIPFSKLIKDYASRYPRWREYEFLSKVGDLRNVVVHQREGKDEYYSVPVPSVVEKLERIRDQFRTPKKVLPKFQKEVVTVQAEDALSGVLKSIKEKELSQFPVYQNGCYIGLLTENGITRWLAKYSVSKDTIIDFQDETVKDSLSMEEQRQNCQFISRNTTVQDAEDYFVRNTMLEALLITETGKNDQTLMGIITRWDVLILWDR